MMGDREKALMQAREAARLVGCKSPFVSQELAAALGVEADGGAGDADMALSYEDGGDSGSDLDFTTGTPAVEHQNLREALQAQENK
jgi:hypothetical protein